MDLDLLYSMWPPPLFFTGLVKQEAQDQGCVPIPPVKQGASALGHGTVSLNPYKDRRDHPILFIDYNQSSGSIKDLILSI